MSRHTIRYLARLAFWCAAIVAYVAAILPGDPTVFSNDKANHMLAFVTLSLLGRVGWSRSKATILALLLIAFGGLIELSQALPIIHRDASWLDLAADAIAVVAGMAIGTVVLRVVRHRSPARAG